MRRSNGSMGPGRRHGRATNSSSYGPVFSMDMDMEVCHGRFPLDSTPLMNHAGRPTRREDHRFSDFASSQVAMEGMGSTTSTRWDSSHNRFKRFTSGYQPIPRQGNQ